MNESVLIVIGSMSFIPPSLLLGDLLELVLKKRPTPMRSSAPAMQIWLQDFFVLAVAFALTMSYFFDRHDPLTMVMPVLSLVLGFAAAIDVMAGDFMEWYAPMSSLTRVIVLGATLTAFGWCPWLAAMIWFLSNRFRARRAGRFYFDRSHRDMVLIATILYSVSFALPMSRSATPKGDMFGWSAYFACFGCFFRWDELPLIPCLAWLANPCFWIAAAFLLQGRRMLAATFALIATGLAFTINDPHDYSLDSAMAYVVWMSSMLVLANFALILAFQNFRSKQKRTID